MGEFNKDTGQQGSDKEQQGEKPAFGQFEKGQQGQEESQKGEDQAQFGQKGEELTGGKGGQQQHEDKGQRQQGDEDLDEDSKSSLDGQGMK